MFKDTLKQLFKTMSGYKLKLTNQKLFILLMVVVLSACCAGLYGLGKYQEGLAMHKGEGSQNEQVPPGTLEPGTGIPVDGNTQTFLSGVGTPDGIPASQIPPGSEDLYILKSQIVPPVCPKCPVVINKCHDNEKKCPPCPACARCPEPNFECKKVPNYRATNTELPMPLLNDFSQF